MKKKKKQQLARAALIAEQQIMIAQILGVRLDELFPDDWTPHNDEADPDEKETAAHRRDRTVEN